MSELPPDPDEPRVDGPPEETKASPLSEEETARVMEVATSLLVAVFGRDDGWVAWLSQSEEVHWWNVALTLAHLVDDFLHGEPEAFQVLAGALASARRAVEPEAQPAQPEPG